MRPKSKRQRVNEPSTSRETYSEDYNMDHLYRGHAVIFHHLKFNKCLSHLEPRKGSEFDVKALKRTLNNLDFDVSIYRDKPLSEIRKIIRSLAEHTDHTNADCIAICVLTHGNENNMVFAKDAPYSLQELWTPFATNNCSSLAGKPKLFFIQACRGKKVDSGMSLRGKKSMRRKEFLRKKENIVKDSECDTYTKPASEDFLVVHSSMEGYESYRYPDKGSWFIQSLCKELQKLTPYTDLLKIITRVVGHVAIDFDTGDNPDPKWDHKKQVPHVHTTLTRDIYFYPKICYSD